MSRADKHQAAGHATMAKRGARLGATDAVREALKAGPLSTQGLMDRTGLPRHTISSVMCALKLGGVVTIGKGHAAKYALYGSPEARAPVARTSGKGSGVIAGIITIGRGMRWPGGVR